MLQRKISCFVVFLALESFQLVLLLALRLLLLVLGRCWQAMHQKQLIGVLLPQVVLYVEHILIDSVTVVSVGEAGRRRSAHHFLSKNFDEFLCKCWVRSLDFTPTQIRGITFVSQN